MTGTVFAVATDTSRTEAIRVETVRRELERVRNYQRSVGYALEGSRSLGLYGTGSVRPHRAPSRLRLGRSHDSSLMTSGPSCYGQGSISTLTISPQLAGIR
jgi:hypothetical protein